MKEMVKILKWLCDDIADNGIFRKDLSIWQGIARAIVYTIYMLPGALLGVAYIYIFYILMSMLPI